LISSSLLLPQANLKAKDLPNDYLPHKEILKAYEEANQEFKFESDASGHDRVWRIWYALVNGNIRTKNQEIEQQVTAVYRVKDSKGKEWLMYHILLYGLNHIGERKDFSDFVGKIEGIPQFERKIDENTGEVVYSGVINNHKTLYTIPFTKETLDNLKPYFVDIPSFAIEGQGLASRTYSCTFEEMRDMEWDELVKAKTAYMYTDYYRNKQQLVTQGGGVS
jgi:hypothetical protein